MLLEGHVIRGDKIGKRANDWYIWTVCPVCCKERWVLRWKIKLPSYTKLCWSCSARKNHEGIDINGANHPRWNGGQTTSKGYVYIFGETHPFCTSKGYVKRARLVLESKLGRYLLPDCIPHHLNHIKDDDRPSNLIELTKSQHTILHAFERRLVTTAKSLGKRKVVEFIEEQEQDDGVDSLYYFVVSKNVWRDLKKEWGIK